MGAEVVVDDYGPPAGDAVLAPPTCCAACCSCCCCCCCSLAVPELVAGHIAARVGDVDHLWPDRRAAAWANLKRYSAGVLLANLFAMPIAFGIGFTAVLILGPAWLYLVAALLLIGIPLQGARIGARWDHTGLGLLWSLALLLLLAGNVLGIPSLYMVAIGEAEALVVSLAFAGVVSVCLSVWLIVLGFRADRGPPA